MLLFCTYVRFHSSNPFTRYPVSHNLFQYAVEETYSPKALYIWTYMLKHLKKTKKQKKSRTKWRPCDTRRSVPALETTGSYKEHPTAFTSPKIPCAAEIFPLSSSTSAPEHPPTPPCPISPGLSIWLSLLLIYYSSSPVSTCGRLLSRDHLMIDGSPEVTQGWGAKEMLGIQHTSWNSLMLP